MRPPTPDGAEDYKDHGKCSGKPPQFNATIRLKTKKGRVLNALARGESFNRFEAERDLHDHCLHSTVAALQAHGITINRQEETVPGFEGVGVRVMRYWLSPAQRGRARVLLGIEGVPDVEPG